jgi:hypothetical protein
MSSWQGTPGQCLARTALQNGSISQNATVCIPARSSPRENPPIPEKRSSTLTSAPNVCGVRESVDRVAVEIGHPISSLASVVVIAVGVPSARRIVEAYCEKTRLRL